MPFAQPHLFFIDPRAVAWSTRSRHATASPISLRWLVPRFLREIPRAAAVRKGLLVNQSIASDEVPAAESERKDWIGAVAQHRDRHAFERLFRHYAPRLQSYMLRAGMDREAAEDLVQETMAEVWRKASLYRPEIAGLSTWIYTIARNRRVDKLRRVRYAEIPLETSEVESADETDIGRRLDALGLLDHIQRLPPEQLSVMQLVYLEGLSHAEISARLQLPLGTVKSRLRLAFAKTREWIGAK